MDDFYDREIDYVSPAKLVEDLLGFDAAALATLAPAGTHRNDPVLLGLKEFFRRTYALAFAIHDEDGVSLRVLTQADARTRGWPNARIGNLATLFAWSMVREFRRYQALPFKQRIFKASMRPCCRSPRKRGRHEIALLSRTLFSAVHGVIALGLEERIVTVPVKDLRR